MAITDGTAVFELYQLVSVATDAWRVKGNELVINGNGTVVDQILIGDMATNYTGSGFKYVFKNGKKTNADIVFNNGYGNLIGDARSTNYGRSLDLTGKTVQDFRNAVNAAIYSVGGEGKSVITFIGNDTKLIQNLGDMDYVITERGRFTIYIY